MISFIISVFVSVISVLSVLSHAQASHVPLCVKIINTCALDPKTYVFIKI
jgi:hypothetical protein